MKLGTHFDPFTKFTTHWLSTSKKTCQTKSAQNRMKIIFFDHKGLIYHHAIPNKTTVNNEYSVLKILRKHIWRKSYELVSIGHCMTIIFTCMLLILFSNTLENAILKSCYILLSVQILHHVISGCFLRWRKSCMAEI